MLAYVGAGFWFHDTSKITKSNVVFDTSYEDEQGTDGKVGGEIIYLACDERMCWCSVWVWCDDRKRQRFSRDTVTMIKDQMGEGMSLGIGLGSWGRDG